MVVALWSREELATDSAVEDPGGWGGVTLAHNVRSPEEVDAVLAEAEAAGATIGRPERETFWGGYSRLFIDPDGHPWEVAHNPHWTIAEDGSVSIVASPYSSTTRTSPSATDWPSSQRISLTLPESSASTGISIFIDSRMTTSSPSST